VHLARRLGDRETIAHGLTNVGSALTGGPDHERGRELLLEAFALAADAGHHDDAARALVCLAAGTMLRKRGDARAVDDIGRALRFAREHELDGYVQYMLGARANLRLLRGDWAGCETDALESLALGEQPGVSLCPALIALGMLQARRGDAAAGATLDDAWRRAVATGEVQRLGPAAAARAEHAWLDDDLEAVAALVRPVHELAVARGDRWACGDLAWWLWRARAAGDGDGDGASADLPRPHALAIAGDWRGAAAAWEEIGFPYQRAETLSDADDEAARLEALAAFDACGATRAAARLRRRLRADGVRRIPRGPRPASRAGLAGLTPRQSEVLALIVEGATNAQIAEALVITPKTVDHHVSAVLAKLGVASRREAGEAAARLAG
jgi:DNA-binding CsgD family transcriptional regulator